MNAVLYFVLCFGTVAVKTIPEPEQARWLESSCVLVRLCTFAHKRACVCISSFVCVPGSLCGLVIGVCNVKTLTAVLGQRVHPSAYE